MSAKTKKNDLSIKLVEKLYKANEKKNFNDKKDTKNNLEQDRKFKSMILNHQYFPLINLLLLELIIILLPKSILLIEPTIELTLNSTGYQQILSYEYRGDKPSVIYVNKEVQIMKSLKVYAESIAHKIILEWEKPLTDLTYMFSNVAGITSVKMNYVSGYGSNLSYMFKDCINLQNFSFVSYNNYSYYVKDTIGMFYNCLSLTTFSFNKMYMGELSNYNSDNQCFRNMSYMFYNCQSLESISFSSNIYYVNDMRRMFYNCISLKSITLNYFMTYNNNNKYVDLSYMFYNCKELSSFSLNNNNFYVKDMNNMFYNCESLKSINLEYFKYYYQHHINMSRLFYNCHNLENINNIFYNFYISDTREMFYNCTSFKSTYYCCCSHCYNTIKFKINTDYLNDKINMSRMFYNCYNLNSISISCSNNKIPINDSNLMFYNCTALTSIKLDNFDVSYAQNMSYMFYNCKSLSSFDISYITYYSNLIKREMKGMFQNCQSLTYLDLSNNFYTKNVEIMWDMFKGCSKLISLNVSNFDTSQVTDMESMFEGCENLVSLNLDSFRTTKVLYMNRMFYNCKSLSSLYFHYITSESLGTMQQMFYNCKNLKYLDIYSLTERAQSISNMFEGASTNIELCIEEHENIPSIFKELYEMSGFSRNCERTCYKDSYKRVYLQQQKFCCKYYEFNGNCYEKCPSRTRSGSSNDGNSNYRKCIYFPCSNYYNYDQDGCISYLPQGYYKNDSWLKTIDKCHDDCQTCFNKATDANHTNCLTCKNSKYIYLGNCYDECIRGKYINPNTNKYECYCFEEKCITCSEETAKKGLCNQCNNTAEYYQKEDDVGANEFDCFQKLDKYYLDKRSKLFRSCYDSCLLCDSKGIEGNHLCNVCDSNHSIAIKKGEYYNCFPNCSHFFYFDNNNQFICTESSECPESYDLFAPEIGQCLQKCTDSDYYRYYFKGKCYSKCPPDTEEIEGQKYFCKLSCPFDRPFMLKSQEICVSNCTINERRDGDDKECITNYFGNKTNAEIQDKILADIEDKLTRNTFNFTNIKDEEYIISDTNTIYELTTSQKPPSNLGISYVDLKDCDTALRGYYPIKKDDPLYILKFDIYIEGKEGPTVDYRVYYPLEDEKILEPLDLTICEGKLVLISFSVNLTGDPDLYNRNSPYYNDLCVSYATSNGVDMTLQDRQRQYIDYNKSLCEEDCTFVGYDTTNKRVECSCEVKFTLPLISEIKIDKNKLYKFMDIKKIANFDVLKCYKLIISKVGIIKNFGFYLFVPTFIMYFVCIFRFYLKEFGLLKQQINDIVTAKKYQKYLQDKKKGMIKPKPKPEPKKQKPIKNDYRFVKPIIFNVVSMFNMQENKISELKLNKNNIIEEKQEKDLIDENNINNEEMSKPKKDDLIEENPKEKKLSSPPIKPGNKKLSQKEKNLDKSNFPTSRNNSHSSNKKGLNLNTINSKSIKSFEDLTNKEKERLKLIMKHNDSELNVLEYKNALKYDDRNYFQYYFSLLKTKHLVIKIISKEDYNSQVIKAFLAFFNFSLGFTVNTLFFSDDTMHKILEDEGEFNFIYQLPQIIYSTIISIIFDSILTFLALSEENVLSVKHEKVLRNVARKAKDTIRALQIKFINFFILSFIFFMGFWYYVTCFCAVYKNTQYHLIKDTLISFGTSLLTPLGISLIPGIFRLPGLKGKKEFLYLLSKIIQLF